MQNKKISPTWTLAALAISAFAIGSAEFISVGIMPLIIKSFDVTIAQAGLTVSLYAMGVMLGAPILTTLTTKFNRKNLLIGIMISFIIGNTIAALAPTFIILLIGRIISALAHGLFMTIASVVAADVVAPNKRASAIAVMFTGLTVATVTGVPLGTYIGQILNWRSSFIFLILLGLIGMIGSIILVPKNLPKAQPSNASGFWRILKQPKLLLIILITALGYGATYPVYTYISSILKNQMGWSDSAIVIILVVYGLAVAIGNTLGGRLANVKPLNALLKMFVGLGVALFLVWISLNTHYFGLVAVLLMGLFAFMNVPGLQLYMLQLAEELTPSEVNLASSLNISAFNIGIIIGSTVGGFAASNDMIAMTPWMGIAMLVIGILLIFYLMRSVSAEKQ
ncbi:MFS transporter [Companilactobacillus ginsenosidimutans]|uniref:MFS sugar transporter n=1 Tax=Companilactobacillus ginsenosidimutans TaxID=1007676 RepID=A0A0H4QLQ9_9LACO|nr:MFS transporter [Companilactobacillus ginsenosidimutans]AKP68041.1 MFS sugar transporter [Companilactobacillus ginsenosidimutans]